MTQPSTEFLDLQAALAGEYSLQRELGRGGMGVVYLAREPDDRFADGEALAAALVPAVEARPALPPTLRAWVGARNPLLVPYMAWSEDSAPSRWRTSSPG